MLFTFKYLQIAVVACAGFAAFYSTSFSSSIFWRLEASAVDAVQHSGFATGKAAAARLDESGYGFYLNIPDDWTADIDTQDGPILSWRLHQEDWLAGRIPDGLLSLSVSVLEPDEGQSTGEAFRRFVDKFGDRFLKHAKVLSFEPFRFGPYSGFNASVSGQIERPAGNPVRIKARLFVYLTKDREVIVSAVAPVSQVGLLENLGQPGSMFEASASEDNSTAASSPEQAAIPETLEEPEPQSLQNLPVDPLHIAAYATNPVDVLPGSLSRFRSVSWGGSPLEEFGSFSGEGLSISMPPNARTGGVGIATSGSIINLGDLDAGAATTLNFNFDPAQSNNALLVLCPGKSVPCLSDPSLLVLLQPEEAGTALSLVADSRPLAKTVLRSGMPSRLTVRIDKDGVYAFPSNGSSLLVDRPRGLVAFAGLELLAAAVPLPSSSQLKITSIAAHTTLGTYAAPGLPEPEPKSRIFPGEDTEMWTEFGVSGGDFPTMATLANGRLEVSVLPGNRWGYTGLLSAAPVFTIPETDGALSPRRLHGKVEPQIPAMAFAVSLIPSSSSDLWLDSVAFAEFSHNEDSSYRVRLTACRSATSVVEMSVDASWAGDFDLLVSRERLWLAAGRHRISLHMNCGLPDLQGHVAVFAASPREHDPAALSLTTLAIDRLRPPDDGLASDASESDDADFDPSVWINALASDLAEATDSK